jgi:DNA-binding NtrC family response regulator
LENDPRAANTPQVIAILNTSQDTIDLLHTLLNDEGFETIAEYVTEFREGRKDFATFFHTYRPAAIVYDIAIPYEANWQFFNEHVRGLQLLPAASFVVTTTNKTVLDTLVGPTDALELIGKPFDLEELVQAVRRAVEQSGG